MIDQHSIAVVIPAWNVADRIAKVLSALPSFVDRAYVVDDASGDETSLQARRATVGGALTMVVIRHEKNQGVGGAIVTGYQRALQDQMQVVAVMAGDGQMDPAELDRVCRPIVEGRADYVKGNRLTHDQVWQVMPKYRIFGNAILSLLTKLASGYWKLADFQTGYTAISQSMLARLPLEKIYRRYGFPNDILVKLNILSGRVTEVPIRPVYDGQRSHIRLWRVVPTISWLLLKGFVVRLKEKYIIADFHPLVFFYFFGLVSFIFGAIFGLYLVIYRLTQGSVTGTSALFASLFFLSGLQSLFFAMWFDMDHNRELQK